MAQLLPVNTFDLIIFGGTGDLAQRKLLPALYHRYRDRQITPESRIIAVSRSDISSAEYRQMIHRALRKYLPADDYQPELWQDFAGQLEYVHLDALDPASWGDLKAMLRPQDERIRVAYLATSPGLFGPIAQGLKSNGLNRGESRIVLEKPVGHDYDSAREINDAVGACFAEERIYRIDHYLGKETVQNLLALRFANSLFEPLWSSRVIDHVQITVAENLGVGERIDFYDNTGALKDMVQNHMLQLLCLVAMEPPSSLDPEAVRDEKLKVLRALKPIDGDLAATHTVRAQYQSGAIQGEAVPGYLDELEKPASDSETFVALKVEIDNWRWSSVPFYLRTGKRLKAKHSEIVVQFQEVPHLIFPEQKYDINPNRLTIRLQPDEGVKLSLMAKEPGPGGFHLRPVSLDLSFEEAFAVRYPDAYERLLMEVIRGNPALFMRRDEIEAAWRWVDGIVQSWSRSRRRMDRYVAGSWGPDSASLLLDRDGRGWHTED